MEQTGKDSFLLHPDDGVRQDIWIISGKSRVHLKLDRDNWSESVPVKVNITQKTAELTIAPASSKPHMTGIMIEPIGCKVTLTTPEGQIKTSVMRSYDIHVEGTEKTISVKWR